MELAIFFGCALVMGWLILESQPHVERSEWLLMIILLGICLVMGISIIATRAGI